MHHGLGVMTKKKGNLSGINLYALRITNHIGFSNHGHTR